MAVRGWVEEVFENSMLLLVQRLGFRGSGFRVLGFRVEGASWDPLRVRSRHEPSMHPEVKPSTPDQYAPLHG